METRCGSSWRFQDTFDLAKAQKQKADFTRLARALELATLNDMSKAVGSLLALGLVLAPKSGRG